MARFYETFPKHKFALVEVTKKQAIEVLRKKGMVTTQELVDTGMFINGLTTNKNYNYKALEYYDNLEKACKRFDEICVVGVSGTPCVICKIVPKTCILPYIKD